MRGCGRAPFLQGRQQKTPRRSIRASTLICTKCSISGISGRPFSSTQSSLSTTRTTTNVASNGSTRVVWRQRVTSSLDRTSYRARSYHATATNRWAASVLFASSEDGKGDRVVGATASPPSPPPLPPLIPSDDSTAQPLISDASNQAHATAAAATTATSPLDGVIQNDLLAMVEEILSFHDAISASAGAFAVVGADNGRTEPTLLDTTAVAATAAEQTTAIHSRSRHRKQPQPRNLRDQWNKNLTFALRFANSSNASTSNSFTYMDDDETMSSFESQADRVHENTMLQRLPWPGSGQSHTTNPRTVAASSSLHHRPDFAMYHALWNDYQSSGDDFADTAVPLESKTLEGSTPRPTTLTTEAAPLVELDLLLDDIEATRITNDGNNHDDTKIVVDDIQENVALSIASPLQQQQQQQQQRPPRVVEVGSSSSSTKMPLLDDTNTVLTSVADRNVPIEAHSTAQSLSLDAWFRDDLMQISLNTTTTLNASDKSRHSLSSWQSELQGPATEMAATAQIAPISALEQSRRNAVTHALVLLRTLNETEWKRFDNPDDADSLLVEADSESAEDEALAIPAIESLKEEGVSIEVSDKVVNASDNITLADTVPAILDLLDLARQGKVRLSTLDCNFMLARLAVATDYLPDDILPLIRQLYRQMVDLSNAGFECTTPDAVTYEILLLVLTRRFGAFQPALDLVVALVSQAPTFSWTAKTLEATLQLCERKNLRPLAEQILAQLQGDAGLGVEIPKRVYQSLINIMKADDVRSSAVDVLRLALKRANRSHDEILDAVFVNAIRWPTQNRHSRSIDNSSVLGEILDVLEQERVYIASQAVWKQMIVSSATGAKDNELRWDFVVRAFRCLTLAQPSYWPDFLLLKHGLAASVATLNADLASDLMWRAVENYQVPNADALGLDKSSNSELAASVTAAASTASASAARLSPTYIRPHVAYQDIVKAMTICIAASDMTACVKILDCVSKLDMSSGSLRSLYLLCLKGHANVGDASGAEKLFVAMSEKGIQPGEEFYGALLLAYGVSKQFDNARQLLQSLESGELQDVRPGPSCYDGNILGCVRSQSWNDAISTYDNMKLSQVVPSPAACHGILLAHARRGGRVDVQTCLEDFISLGAQLRIDGLLFALSMLVPEMELKERVDMESVRNYLRSICEKDMTLKSRGLNLMRSLRIAELEEQRTETPGLSESAIATRRKEALDVVLRDVVAFANTAATDRVA